MGVAITPFYGGLLGLLFVGLAARVIAMRRSAHIGLGDGGDKPLMRRIRVHANFAEYVPLVLVLMALAELQGFGPWALHILGGMMVAGRAIHAFGVGTEPERPHLRVIGMAATMTAMVVAALANLLLAVSGTTVP